MTVFPALAVGTTLVQNSAQLIQVSIHGRRLGLGSSGVLINAPGGISSSAGTEMPPYPLVPEAGAVITATTADTIGNFGNYSASSSAVSAVFTLADPVPGADLDIQFSAGAGVATTAVKFVTASSNVNFSSTAGSNVLSINSSLFFGDYAITLQGQSTGAYKVKSYFSRQGSTILPTYATA